MNTKSNLSDQRVVLVDHELRMLGIRDEAVLHAMRTVPREEFVPQEMREFAYRNVPLPIAAGQTISQPLIVAHMIEALELSPDDRVLEVGAGSGYAAAVLSRVAKEVFTVERHRALAEEAQRRLTRLRYDNVHVLCADGTRGWPEEAPFDAIIVAAGGPHVPRPLLDQLRVGGRLVIPVGEESSQKLIRVVRRADQDFEYEELMGVRFVPLIGEGGWPEENKVEKPRRRGPVEKRPVDLPNLIRQTAEAMSSIDKPPVGRLLERIGDARLVLIGEATHGSSEFYRLRAAITSALIEQKDFQFIAVEADWPDAYRIHDFVTHRQREVPHDWEAFARFPTWMWRNQEVLDFIHRLRDFNLRRSSPQQRVGFFGLDLYSLFTSIECVLNYLDRVDPAAAAVARLRYGCLSPWEADSASYGRAALVGRYRTCEGEAVQMLRDLLNRRLDAAVKDGEALFDAQLNAQLIADAEKYYRIMYYGADESWNHRDRHMFATLCSLLDRYGPESKAVIWAHNSHLGDAAATQFGAHGQTNLGQLCRERFGEQAYLIGQGTDHGTVAAASNWEAPMEIKQVRPSHPDSYEQLMHLSEMNAFFLPLTKSKNPQLTAALAARRLERAIGVVYRPDSERLSHYFDASLSHQFDEWIWIDETSAVRPLTTQQRAEHEPAHPFAIIDR